MRRNHLLRIVDNWSVVSLVLFSALSISGSAAASESLIPEPDGRSYNFVTHYTIDIEAPVSVVWRHMRNLRSWMYEYELAHVAGTPRAEGEILLLYPGQDYLIQVTHLLPNQLMVIANLPSTFKDEQSTGIGVFALHGNGTTTAVNLTMSRRYTWHRSDTNPQREIRESKVFRDRTRAMWQDRFLNKLKDLSELN